MPSTLPKVRPGDLITADFMNALLDCIEQLEQRIDGLDGGTSPGGPPVIVTLLPSDQLPIGSEVTMIGSGFGIASENVVNIAGLAATVLRGGGTSLTVQVPTVPGVPLAGLLTQLTVNNPRGFDNHQVRVLPAVTTLPEGQLFANMTSSPGGTITEGTTVDFLFSVQAVVNIEESYTLSPLLSPQSNPSQWQAVVLDSADSPLPIITIPAGSPPAGVTRQVKVRVTVPSGTNGTSADLSLTVRSQRKPSLATTSSTVVISVGSSAPAPALLTVTRGSVNNGSLDTDGTVVARTSTTRVTFSVSGVTSGEGYTIDLGTTPTNWTSLVVGGPTHSASSSQLTWRADFIPSPGAAAATFNIRVSQTDDSSVFGALDLAVRPE